MNIWNIKSIKKKTPYHDNVKEVITNNSIVEKNSHTHKKNTPQ